MAEVEVPIPTGIEFYVAGCMYYQEALEVLAGGKSEDGCNFSVVVNFHREPSNIVSETAIMCMIKGRMVGHLNHEASQAMQQFFIDCEERRVQVRLNGRIVGGWRKPFGAEADFWVELDLPGQR